MKAEVVEEEKIRGSSFGIELKIGRKWRSCSRKVGEESCVVRIDGMEQSWWANMPPEILREVLIKLENSESEWPMRGNVIACAGVCRRWREVIKDIVKTPELSGRITFPISVKQPGPRNNVMKCFFKRNRSLQTYQLYLSLNNALAEDGKFLLAARKFRRATCNDYVISFHPDDMARGGSTYIGKLRSNFLGTKFTLYDLQMPHVGAKIRGSCSTRMTGPKMVSQSVSVGYYYAVAHISYDSNVLGSRGPRKMLCVMDSIPASTIETGGLAPTPTQLPLSSLGSVSSLPFFRSKSNCTDDASMPLADAGALMLKNKAPRWHEQLQCWCLNFHGRVTVASVKNFQLVASPEDGVIGAQHETVILQFGKVGKDVFTMDYCYPISAFQAFAICLSSFDTKISCE